MSISGTSFGILAFDISLTPGWCSLRFPDETVEAAGHFDCSLKKWEGGGLMTWRFGAQVEELLQFAKPRIVVYELVSSHTRKRPGGGISYNTRAAHVYGALSHKLLEVCDNRPGGGPAIPCDAIPVPKWKAAAVGRGNAGKDMVAKALARMLPPDLLDDYREGKLPFDVTDAVGIAIGYARTELRHMRLPMAATREG